MTRPGSAPMQKLLKTLMLTLMTAACGSLSAAPVGYSINSDSPSEANTDGLYRIDLASGEEIERIGTVETTGFVTITDVEGLAFAPDGTLYGIDDDQLILFPIDTLTAKVDPNDGVTVSGLTPGENDFGMTFACDDALYITTVGSLENPNRQSLYNVSPLGVTTLIGSAGSLGANISALAAYGNPVRLFGLGNGTAGVGAAASQILYEINPATGVATEIGPLGASVGAYTEGGLAFDESGQLWAITDRRTLGLPSQVMRINTSTGTASEIHNTTEQGFESMAISPPRGCTPQGTGENARFVVQKRFDDSNNTVPVKFNIRCNTGLPLEQSLTVLPNPGDFGKFEVTFIVGDFTDGALNCEVWEEAPSGYSPDYDCQSGSSCSTSEGTGPCSFQNIGSGQENLCLIQNFLDPVELTVTKEWVYDNQIQAIDEIASIDLYCAHVVDGDGEVLGNGLMHWSWLFNGNPASHKAIVYPEYDGTTKCWTAEIPSSSPAEPVSSCSEGIFINPGDAERTCTVINTVFFEGIPSLNQYGLLLITALMVLTGLIAVRRYG